MDITHSTRRQITTVLRRGVDPCSTLDSGDIGNLLDLISMCLTRLCCLKDGGVLILSIKQDWVEKRISIASIYTKEVGRLSAYP